MKAEFIQLSWVRGLLFMAILLSQKANAILPSGTIDGFNLNSCGTNKCFQIQSPKASVGVLNGNYGFAEARFTVFNKNKKASQIKFTSSDLYFDQIAKKVFIRRIKEKPHQDACYDLKTEELNFFPSGI